MKKSIFLSIFLLSLFKVFGQDYYMATPQGYAATVTGGGNATPVTVTTYTAFRNALLSTTAANSVILVSGTIDCLYTSVTLNNKTIIGLPGARLRNTQITVGNSTTSANNSGILNIKPGSNNVIIRNLIFEGPGAYDVDGRDNLTNEGTNIWVDHCEFQDGMDGNFDNKGLADNVTVSWCKFTYLKPAIPGGSGGSNDHRFSNLVGSSSSDAPADGNYSITFQNCYWASGCKERMPRARNAQLHILSCYYNPGVSSSRAIGLGGGTNNTTCYVENTHFAGVTNVYTSYIGSDGGTVGINYSNCLNGATNIGTVTAPSYTTTPIPVNQVASYLTDATCGAGATLQVTSNGTVSPSVCTLGITNEQSNLAINFYPTLVENILTIELLNSISGKANFEIYSLIGQKVYSFSKNTDTNEVVELNIGALQKGIYIARVTIDSKSIQWKFVKN
ncbi:T9SS type A sorting domain-containing protein [Flavobacterium sp.]|uniref:pectate lyase family protein n=1 Tax=Flavobacterium sp. TaxID=239 RepID=UPI00391C8F84